MLISLLVRRVSRRRTAKHPSMPPSKPVARTRAMRCALAYGLVLSCSRFCVLVLCALTRSLCIRDPWIVFRGELGGCGVYTSCARLSTTSGLPTKANITCGPRLRTRVLPVRCVLVATRSLHYCRSTFSYLCSVSFYSLVMRCDRVLFRSTVGICLLV